MSSDLLDIGNSPDTSWDIIEASPIVGAAAKVGRARSGGSAWWTWIDNGGYHDSEDY